ncbi:hypothetical protein [Cellulomonas cellasea]|uniref:Uncharacterized protein n=2 Tax=Cellulomonas cellasea TaxID=43670 RepID=A0A0A0B9S7_9CELL|nr:hypothetical protein [Cellulomonas cellasea]KGM02006.1 hypothetical protein Q760_16120 [Cellulomonas cellasea DSM 20118]GEA90110.1 hypothetical protein CCE01nite_40590 [Cellulomonas cellasea]
MLLPIDTARLHAVLAATAGEARPAQRYEGSGADARAVGQATNDAGVPLWQVEAVVAGQDGAETIRVRIPAMTAPNFPAPLAQLTITGLTARVLRDGRVSYSADSVVLAPKSGGHREG